MKMVCFFLILTTSTLVAVNSKKSTSTSSSSQLKTELESLQEKMAATRIRAHKTREVQAAHAKVVEAFRNYYKKLHSKMIELDPKMKALIERDQEIRSKLVSTSKSKK